MKNIKLRKVLSIVLSGAIFLSSIVATLVVATAKTPDSSGITVNFDDNYVIADDKSTRDDTGTYSIASDATAEDGKYLKYTQDGTKNEHPAYHIFVINPTGCATADADKVISLKVNTKYKITVRYKIEGIGDSQKWQFRIYQSAHGTYTANGRQDNSRQVLFAGQGPVNSWDVKSQEIMFTNTSATNQCSLLGALVPSATMSEPSETPTKTAYTTAIDYIKVEEVVEAPAQTADGTGKFDFNCYTVSSAMQHGSKPAGVFSIGSDAACTDGKYLSFVDDNSKNANTSTKPSHFIHNSFVLNHTGATAAADATKLIAGQDYKVKVRYKLTGLDSQYKMIVKLYNSGSYTIDQWSGDGGEKSVTITENLPLADTFTEKEFEFTAPSKGNDDAYSLLASFAPAKSGSFNADATFDLQIDYIEIIAAAVAPEQNADGTGKFDFNFYTADADSCRTNAGTYSVESDSLCTDGKYLKFLDNSTTNGTHIMHNSFILNHTGKNVEADATKLIPGQSYDVKIRYKLTGLDSQYKMSFRLYNSYGYKLTEWSPPSGKPELKVTVTEELPLAAEWTEETYTFIAPSNEDRTAYSLLGTFAAMKNNTFNAGATFGLSVDYIEISKSLDLNVAPDPSADGTGKYDFDCYVIGAGTIRSDKVPGPVTIETDPECTDSKHKYLRFEDNTTNTAHQAFNMFQLNHTGNASLDEATKLIAGKKYDVTIRYKLTGLASDYAMSFRLYNTWGSANLTDWSGTGNMVEATNALPLSDTWIEKSYTITAPAVPENGKYSLVADFLPIKAGSVNAAATFVLSVDWIDIKESTDSSLPLEDYMELNFDQYTVDKYSTRLDTFANAYSIEDSADCEDGKYLKFVDDKTDTSNNFAHYMFQANPTGSSSGSGVTRLVVGAPYQVKIRYRLSGLEEGEALNFRLYNLGSNMLSDWSTGGVNYVECSNNITNTDGEWKERVYTSVIAPNHANGQYSLAACLAPFVDNNNADPSATYVLEIDYIILTRTGDGAPVKDTSSYPLEWDDLPEVDADEKSKIVFYGKDNSFWCNQFDSGKDKAISYGWTRLERDDPNYPSFQSVNTLTMTNETDFYEYEKSNFITAFQGEPIDITDYIKTGTLRFWVKVDRDVTVKMQLQDKKYVKGEILVDLKKTDENNGFYEVRIPLKDFYNEAMENDRQWNHGNMWAIVIYPTERTPEAFMKNGESMVFSRWEIWSKEPLENKLDMNIYYYSQLGSDIKVRDNNQVLPSSTTIRSFRVKAEEESVAKLIAEKYKGAKLLEYWAIYAISNAQTGSYIEAPYDDVELLIPKTGAFADKNLQIGVLGTDGSITIIPFTEEENNLLLKTSVLGNFVFISSDKKLESLAADGKVNSSTGTVENNGGLGGISPETGDKGYIIARIWMLAFVMSALVLSVIWFDKLKSRKNLTKMLSLMLCMGIVLTTLAGCGDNDEGEKKPANKPTTSQSSDTTSETKSEDEVTSIDTTVSDTTSSDDGFVIDEDEDEDEDEEEEITESSNSVMSMGLVVDHPGVPGYDAEYEFRVSLGDEDGSARLDKSLYTLSCSHKEVVIKGNKVTLPASFKDNTDVNGVLIKATYKEDPSVYAYYPLQITKYTQTFADEFNEDGTPLDRNLWTNQEDVYHDAPVDMKNGKTNIRLDQFVYKKDGNLVMPIVKNETGESWMVERGNGKVLVTADYVSPEIRTDLTFAQQFGCFTVKMKGPASNTVTAGTNNAFWLMPENGTWGKTYFFDHNSGKRAGQATGEIDIVERSAAWGGEWQNTLHTWDPITGVKGGEGVGFVEKFVDENLKVGDWMEYTCVWTRDSLYTYVNGELVRAEKDLTPYEDVKAYMILSQNLNSMSADEPAWTGYATEADLDDLTVYVDYVRAYSLS